MNILITGAWNPTDKQLEAVKALGHSIIFMQNEKDKLPCDPSIVEAVICNGLFLYHDIDKFTSLRYIQLTSAGFDRVPMDVVKKRGIEIHNARGVYSIPMAEYAILGVLELYKNAFGFRLSQKNHRWEKRRSICELYGKTVLIIGCGNVGTECAKRFLAFGCKIIGLDAFPRDNENYEVVLPIDKMSNAVRVADIIVLTLPLTEKTKHIIDKRTIQSIKEGSILVNIARGAIIETAALIEALVGGKLGGAVLDVFEEEPLPESSPLWDMDNVVITPHNSFVGDGNGKRLFEVIHKNLLSFN